MAKTKRINSVVEILMQRDGNTRDEAISRIKDCISELKDALDGTSSVSAEEVLEEELGLGSEYLFDLIGKECE